MCRERATQKVGQENRKVGVKFLMEASSKKALNK
jgi:hypothetical protein